MGFKRTAEGRVFFSGSGANDDASGRNNLNEEYEKLISGDDDGEEAVDVLRAPLSGGSERSLAMSGGQLQVLSLLKSLNEKLQLSQLERSTMRQELESYRKLVESLEEKARATDMAYRELRARVTSDEESVQRAGSAATQAMAEMEKTRSMMLKLEGRAEEFDRNLDSLLGQAAMHKQVSVALSKKQVDLERKYNEHSERISRGVSKYQELLDRVEGSESKLDRAMEKQERFLERLEQEARERAVFMQRFEERALLEGGQAVLTHTAEADADKENTAKAAKAFAFPFPKAALLQPHPSQVSEDLSFGQRFVLFWDRPVDLRMPVILSMALVFALLGWAINALQRPSWPTAEWFAQEAEVAQPRQSAREWQSSTDVGAYSAPEDVDGAGRSFGPIGLDTDSVTASTSMEGAAEAVPDAAAQADLNEMMDIDPDAVAAALNAIEPGNSQASDGSVMQDQGQALENEASAQGAAGAATGRRGAVADMSAPPQVNRALPAAVKEIEAMAISGVAEAQHDLAAIYVTGHGGVRQDYAKAAYWFDKAAQGGVANAGYNLGVLYHQGLGVPKDVAQAIRWYKMAAEKGHPEAQYNLGIAYVEGIGVEYDPVAASLHFESAAQNGVTEAAYNLGLIYENGLLGTARPDEALMWYKIAADAGSTEAQSALQQLADSLHIDMKEIDRIVEDVRQKKGVHFMQNEANFAG